MSEKILYVKEGCPYCARMAEDLNKKGAAFKKVDIDRDAAALREIKGKYGATKVPVLVDGDQVTIGFQGDG